MASQAADLSGGFVVALAHINIIVDDIERATEFYGRTLGFKQAFNKDEKLDFKNVELAAFAKNAGFLDGKVKVDVRFLVHPKIGLHLELMNYQHPTGSQEIKTAKINDAGGVRHISLAVNDAVKWFSFLKSQSDVKMINASKEYGPPEYLETIPIRFFYWSDPWGVIWEMEEGGVVHS